MTYLHRSYTSLIAIYSIVIFSGCANTSKQAGQTFDSSAVDSMLIRFEHKTDFFGIILDEQAISSEIAHNLSEWGYKVTATNTKDQSHNMSLNIGAIKNDATPAGFSFSSGNSDPRSLNFQKADILPMTCFLSPKDHPEQSAELSVMVTADEYLSYAKKADKQTKLTHQLTNDLSTACFNLLSRLNVANQPQTHSNITSSTKPGWIPEIRVEVENSTNPVASTSSTVEQKQNSKQAEPRKRIIIHNQGTPVIFKFGYDRL